MYLGNKFNEQLNVYSEYRLLSFETHYINLNVETCLVWIRNFLALVPTKSKIKYSMFFLEVVELLQTYTDFIK